jgi:hypothetical protein
MLAMFEAKPVRRGIVKTSQPLFECFAPRAIVVSLSSVREECGFYGADVV